MQTRHPGSAASLPYILVRKLLRFEQNSKSSKPRRNPHTPQQQFAGTASQTLLRWDVVVESRVWDGGFVDNRVFKDFLLYHKNTDLQSLILSLTFGGRYLIFIGIVLRFL